MLGSYFVSQGLSKYTTLFCIFLAFALVTLPVCLHLLNQMNIQPSNIEEEMEVSRAMILVITFRKFKNITFLLTIFIIGLSYMTLLGFFVYYNEG